MPLLNNNIGEHLLKHHIKPSYPRIKVLQYLMEKRSHPTVDEIYNELGKEIPTLSKTTVYNTLDLFVKADLVKLITIEGHEARYDVDISGHGHFKCKSCGKIYDFHLNMDDVYPEELHSFIITEKNIYFKGICSQCSF